MLIDRNTMKTLREKINEELTALGEELGLTFKAANGSFDREGKYGSFKLEIATLGDTGEVVNKDAEVFKRQCSLYGLKPEHLGQSFLYGGKKMKIVGLKPRAYQYPIQAEDQTGNKFKFPADMVCSALGLKPLLEKFNPTQPLFGSRNDNPDGLEM